MWSTPTLNAWCKIFLQRKCLFISDNGFLKVLEERYKFVCALDDNLFGMKYMSDGRFHIVGAGGGIGRWFSLRLSDARHSVYCYDIKPDTLLSLPENVVKCPLDSSRFSSQYSNNFHDGDIVLLAVPQEALSTLGNDLQSVASRSLVVSMTSVQTEPLRILNQWKLESPPLGCHPLFGSTVPSAVGQLVALTEFQQSAPLHSRFVNHLRDLGLIPTYLPAEKHDRLMGLVQALPHFTFLVFVKCLTQLSNDPSSLFNLRTPNFQFLHAFACRFLRIAPTTTGSIQFAPDAKEIRKQFVSIAGELCNALDNAITISAATQIIAEVGKPLAGSHVDEGVQIAAFAVDTVQRFENVLHQHLVSKRPFVFRNRISNDIHVVRIIENASTEIRYEETTLMKDNMYAIGLDEISRTNYLRIGLSFGQTLKETIKKRNIVLLEDAQVESFWKSQVLPITFRISIENPHGLREAFFEEWLPRLVPGVRLCAFLESFRKRSEIDRVLLDVTYEAQYEENLITDKIRNIVQEIRLDI